MTPHAFEQNDLAAVIYSEEGRCRYVSDMRSLAREVDDYARQWSGLPTESDAVPRIDPEVFAEFDADMRREGRVLHCKASYLVAFSRWMRAKVREVPSVDLEENESDGFLPLRPLGNPLQGTEAMRSRGGPGTGTRPREGETERARPLGGQPREGVSERPRGTGIGRFAPRPPSGALPPSLWDHLQLEMDAPCLGYRTLMDDWRHFRASMLSYRRHVDPASPDDKAAYIAWRRDGRPGPSTW